MNVYGFKILILRLFSEEEDNNTNYFSSNNTIIKESRCESILKENLNPLRLSFLNQKQDNKDNLKQQNQVAKPNDNFLLNDYLPNSNKSNCSLAESKSNTYKSNKQSDKYHNKYSKSSKIILIDLNEDN